MHHALLERHTTRSIQRIRRRRQRLSLILATAAVARTAVAGRNRLRARFQHVLDVRRLGELKVGKQGSHLDALLGTQRLVGSHLVARRFGAASRIVDGEQFVVERQVVGRIVITGVDGGRVAFRLAVALGVADATVRIAPAGRRVAVGAFAQRTIALVVGAAGQQRMATLVVPVGQRGLVQFVRDPVVIDDQTAVASVGRGARASLRVVAALGA